MKVLGALLAFSAVVTAAPSNVGIGGGVVKGGFVAGGGSGGGSHYESAGAGGGAGGVFSFSASVGGSGGTVHKHVAPEVVSEKVYDVKVDSPPPLPAKKTVIERTVIPQYVEKTVQVPTYVEKTIRVPTYVEKKVKVPAAPKIIEKEISHEEVPVPKEEVKVVEHHNVAPVVHHKVVSAGGRSHGGYGGGYSSGGGGFSFNAAGAGQGGGLFDAIFNIPIQTLGAVNRFLNGLAGGVSVSASKSYSLY